MILTDEAIQKKQKIDLLEKEIMKLEVEKKSAELGFIKARELSVDDLAEIEDEKEFYLQLGEFYALPEINEITKKIREAEEEKRLIENEILELALSLVPTDVADNFRRYLHLASLRKEIITTFLRHIKQ